MSKLVRDNIIEIIKRKGENAKNHTATNQEYRIKLLEKLKEEINEFINEPNKEEIADVQEVIHAIIKEYDMNEQEIEEIRIKKHKERGGFDKKIILD